MPGTIGIDDAARAHAVEIAEVEVVVEEELGDGARRAGVDLGGEHVDVGLDGRAVGMLLGIGRDRDLGVALPLDAGDQIGGVEVAAGMRRVALADAAERIAAQRHDVAHAGRHVARDHRVDVLARVAATQVRCAAGISEVSARMRLTVACVRSRVEPPAP